MVVKLLAFKVQKRSERQTISVPNDAHNSLCVLIELLVIVVSVCLLQQV